MHPASRRRRREAVRGRASLHSSQPVADVRGELELLRFNGAAQPVAQLVCGSSIGDDRTLRRLISAADVARASVHAAKEIAHALLERVVTVSAAETAG